MKVAVIGGGIAGLTCCEQLSHVHQVSLFEKNDYIGGHTHTVDVQLDGHRYAIDTGFIVFNDRTYPHFQSLLDRLGVAYQPTQMSYAVSNRVAGLEYNGHSLSSLFAQRRNLLRPSFYRLLADIVRFNREVKAALANNTLDRTQTLGDYLQQQGYSELFKNNYLLCMGAAIWSSGVDEMSDFPLYFFARFFNNHGLLNIQDRPQWYVISGGSREYVSALLQSLAPSFSRYSGATIVRRHANGVSVTDVHGHAHDFDKVIFACHSDQALALLAEPTADERAILGALPYQDNDVVLHTDLSRLPRRRRAWASWNSILENEHQQQAQLTYNMNILQGLSGPHTFCVSLNQNKQIAADKKLATFCYAHPVFNTATIAAQQRRHQLQGQQHSYYCGAYWYNGFHEDGVRSALDVCKQLQ